MEIAINRIRVPKGRRALDPVKVAEAAADRAELSQRDRLALARLPEAEQAVAAAKPKRS